jgi:ligand-binding sensor domain-containing protein
MRLFLAILLLYSQAAWTQTEYHFSKLTVADGLSDGYIQAIGQDKYGYMWFSTLGDVCRFDGRRMTHFKHQDSDTTSILSGYPQTIASDSSGRLFIGFSNGLMEFDFQTRKFHRITPFKAKWIWWVLPIRKDLILVTTTEGLFQFNPITSEVIALNKKPELSYSFEHAYLDKGSVYLPYRHGIVVYDLATQKARKLPLVGMENADFRQLVVDDKGYIWVAAKGKHRILRISADGTEIKSYDQFLIQKDLSVSTNHIIKDHKGRIWITIKYNGLLQYDPVRDAFLLHQHDPEKTWSLSSDEQYTLFCSRKGIVWCGGDNVNFFHPDKTFFTTLLPFDTDLEIRKQGGNTARAPKGKNSHPIIVDKDKNLWLGTRNGLVLYDVQTKKRRVWRNEHQKTVLWTNNIVELSCDKDNNVWIGTAAGVNRYNRKTGQIEFLGPKDSFPNELCVRLYHDKQDKLWISPRISSLRYYNPTDKKAHTFSNHPLLSQLKDSVVWAMIQDRKDRYWFVMDESGLAMYDPKTETLEKWRENTEGGGMLSNTNIIDIKEDKNGLIWLATYSGLTSFDYDKKEFKNYPKANLGGTIFNVNVDNQNRLWIATGRGLILVDSSRQKFTQLGISDGLPSLEFMKTPTIPQSDGIIRLPTRNGFVMFNPDNYQAEKWFLDFYVTSFSSKGIERPILEDDGNLTIKVDLDADENSFQFNFSAINFLNPAQTWFAYKLEGFDNDWHFTQDTKAVYTNVAGGNYVFRYKASPNVNDWSVPEKTIKVHLDTVFYKAWWFWSLLLGLIGFGAFQFYKFRENQRHQVFDLLSKAQLLEKEKAVMQYEGLKQQLNPHFLFNSLTSLGSLIQIDPSVAGTFLENLSKTYRYILKSSESDTVLLRDEIVFVQNFVMLQKTRFETGFEVNFNIDEASLQLKIVPVTIQNLIENAIKHNIIDDETPLVIDIFTENLTQNSKLNPQNGQNTEGGYLVVKNNLQRKQSVATSNKRGLENLRTFYSYLTDKPIEIIETEIDFSVKVPLIT